jgi:hypothetical protein
MPIRTLILIVLLFVSISSVPGCTGAGQGIPLLLKVTAACAVDASELPALEGLPLRPCWQDISQRGHHQDSQIMSRPAC